VRNLKFTALVLGLALSVSAQAAGIFHLIIKPLDSVVADFVPKLARKGLVEAAQQEGFASIRNAFARYLKARNLQMPTDEAGFKALLDSDSDLKRAFGQEIESFLGDQGPRVFGRAVNDSALLIDESVRVMGACSRCGFSQALADVAGVRMIVKALDADGSKNLLTSVPSNATVLRSKIVEFSNGLSVAGLSKAEIASRMAATDLEKKLTVTDLQRLYYTLNAVRSGDDTTKRLAKEVMALNTGADGKVRVADNRIYELVSTIIASQSDDAGQQLDDAAILAADKASKEALADELAAANRLTGTGGRKLTPQERISAVCKSFADKARGNATLSRSFNELRSNGCFGGLFSAPGCSL
jgi:hypothetical protein